MRGKNWQNFREILNPKENTIDITPQRTILRIAHDMNDKDLLTCLADENRPPHKNVARWRG
jgi:hypothetical protein